MHIRSKEIAYMGMLMAVAIVFILIGCYFDVSTIFFLAAASFLAGCVERNLSLVKAMIFVIGTTIIGLILSPQKLYLVTFFGFCVYVLLAERIQEKEEQGQTSFLVKRTYMDQRSCISCYACDCCGIDAISDRS